MKGFEEKNIYIFFREHCALRGEKERERITTKGTKMHEG